MTGWSAISRPSSAQRRGYGVGLAGSDEGQPVGSVRRGRRVTRPRAEPWTEGEAMSLGTILATTAMGLALLLLVGPFLVPVPPLKDTVAAMELADRDSRFVKIGGLSVHLKTAGEGTPALLLLHGFSASVFSWREMMPVLADWGRVTAFDRPPFGLTDRPTSWEGTNPYSLIGQAALTLAVMDAFGVERAVLVGHSAGGTLATHLALEHPDRVAGLVLISPAIGLGSGLRPGLRWVLSTPQARRLGRLFVRRAAGNLDEALPQAWHDPTQVTAEILEGYKRPLRTEGWDRGLWELTLAARPSEVEARLDEIHVPVLIITGDSDQLVPTERTVRLAERFPEAELLVLPDCGHVPHEEAPDAVLSAIEAFLRSRDLLN